ncbi:hypothetical protein F2Q68_00007572 [Brassica cretica]|uniref:Uncharacterized protein n=1 Tax=Brassica cretica TaxID=69181 RepID=A0A8S9L1U6_BRACR|nr:hypothetical protein F2Q68_00007572 [Brassica cretica]
MILLEARYEDPKLGKNSNLERGVSCPEILVSIEARGVTVHGSSTCSLTCRSTRWIDQARGVAALATAACGQPCVSCCGAL